MKTSATVLLTLFLAAAVPVTAMAADAPGKATESTSVSAAASAMSAGEVKKIDKDAGKITIKHGPLANLDMPAMTMVFRVKDAAMLDQVKSGDQIKFMADKVNGALTVTMLQAN